MAFVNNAINDQEEGVVYFDGVSSFTGLNLTSGELVVGNGTGIPTAIAYSATGGTSNIVARDSNGNSIGNNLIGTLVSTATAASTTTLSASSAQYQRFTGATTQTIVLPDATTLSDGWEFEIVNDSTGTLTIQNHTPSTLFTLPGGSGARVICANDGSAAGTWTYRFLMPENASYGTAGMAITGTLSATTSVSSPEILVTGSSSGTVSILPQVNAGTFNLNLPTTAGASGYLLTSGGGGSSPMTWTAPTAVGAVSSIAGTAHQINASSSTGDVTLSLSSTIITPGTLALNGFSTGSVLFIGSSSVVSQSNSNFYFQSGQFAIGTNNPLGYTPFEVSSAFAYSAYFTGVGSGVDGANNQAGIVVQCSYNPTGGASNCISVYSESSWVPGLGDTIGLAAHFYAPSISNGGEGTISAAYGGYFGAPSSLTGAAIYADDVSIGYTATTPPSNGLLVSGITGCGTSSPGTDSKLVVSSTLTNAIKVTGTQVANVSNQNGIFVTSTFSPPGNTTYTLGIQSLPTYIGANTFTITDAAALYAYNTLSSNIGTITNAYGLWVDTGSSATGTVTYSYGVYASNPSGGSTKIAIYGDNMSIGYPHNAPSTNGLLVSGSVGVGKNTFLNTNGVEIFGKYFVTTNNTTSAPASDTSNGGLAISWNQTNGNAEVDFWNIYDNASQGYYFNLKTGAATFTTPLKINPGSSTFTYSSGGNVLLATDGTREVTLGYNSTIGWVGTVSNHPFYLITDNGSGGNAILDTSGNFYPGADASQTLGTSSKFWSTLYADNIVTKPASSHTATTAFGSSLTAGTALQNTTGYDLELSIMVTVTASTAATITLGVGSSSTPTTDTIVPSFTVAAASFFGIHARVPNNYYVLVNTTGTITVGSITVVAMGA